MVFSIVSACRRPVLFAAALAGAAAALAAPARAQSALGSCADLDGFYFERDSLSVITSQALTIGTLNDDDAISLEIAANSGAAGLVSSVVTIGGATVFSETFTFTLPGGGGFPLGPPQLRSAAYDPPSDATNVALTIDTAPFTSPEGSIEVTIRCTPGPSASAAAATTTAASTTFATERVRRLLEERPDRARFVRKQLKALWGGGSNGADTDDVALADRLTETRNRRRPVRVAEAPANRMLVGMAARDATLSAYAYDDSSDEAGCDEGRMTLRCLDVWTEAHYTRFNDEEDRDGDFTVVYVGADMHLTPWVVAGLLGQMDWMSDDMPVASTRIRSTGWMVGPYASMRLTPDLYFDIRAAWGRSDTDVTALGAAGSYATARWLATAQLTGNFHTGDIRVTPEVSVEYIEEKLDGITGRPGLATPEQTVRLGRVRAGPEMATLVALGDGMVLEPRVAFRGIWDFEPADTITIGNASYGDGRLRGVVEGGAILHGLDGLNLSVSGKYEGIGLNGFHAYGGSLWVNVPL